MGISGASVGIGVDQGDNVLNTEGPVLCELMISPDETVSPRTKTIVHEDGTMESYPLEKMWPLFVMVLCILYYHLLFIKEIRNQVLLFY